MKLTRLEKARRQLSKIKFTITDSGCYIPHRRPNRNGYVNTNLEGKQFNLSRLVAYVHHGLDIDNPKELALHSLNCHNRRCMNKDHIYVGNHSQNTLDAVQQGTHAEASKTHCPKGHRYDKVLRVRGKKIGRYCSKCTAEHAREYRK